MAHQMAHEILRGDKHIVREAVKQNGMALGYASETVKADRDIISFAIKCQADNITDLKSEVEAIDEENKKQKESIASKDKEIAELKEALALSKPIDVIDISRNDDNDDPSNDSERPVKRARAEIGQGKSSLAVIHEQSQTMVKVKQEAQQRAAVANQEKEAALLKLECPICMETNQEESFALPPCGDVMCADCAKVHAIESCPTCRRPVERRIRLHR